MVSHDNRAAMITDPAIADPAGAYTGWNLYRSPYPDGELADEAAAHLARTRTEP